MHAMGFHNRTGMRRASIVCASALQMMIKEFATEWELRKKVIMGNLLASEASLNEPKVVDTAERFLEGRCL